ncbi:MAG TPA: hypothetical protein VF331_24040 [Polyangiales bacterium]
MDISHQHTSSPNPQMPLLMQEASDLLKLLGDETIWLRLVHGGVREDARDGLASALDATRGNYRRCRDAHERSQHPDHSLPTALAEVPRSTTTPSDELDGIMSSIRVAGRDLFRDTTSLTQRFTSVSF